MSAELDLSVARDMPFIDHRGIDWREVRRTRYALYEQFRYDYPGPIRNLKQRLVVVPADHYGAQAVRNHRLIANPAAAATRERDDAFGNRILELDVAQADRAVVFEVMMTLENEAGAHEVPVLKSAAQHFLQFTRLTTPDARIHAIARQLANEAKGEDLAQAIHEWVHGAIHYQGGLTSVTTTAAGALQIGRGLCQDYAHVMLAIARAAGLPARYVSGHLLGEGGSHAWVEVLLPQGDRYRAVAFDPTNNRRPHLGYITVAVGRDYRDVSPTSGVFTAPYNGQLTCRKHAGLTWLEYRSGETVKSQS